MPSGLLYRGPALEVLHEEYAKRGRVDDRAPICATRSVHIAAAPGRVWEVLSDATAWPVVDPGIRGVHAPAGVAVDAPFTWVNGGARLRSRFAVVAPDRELTWTGVSFGARAVHRHVLQVSPGGGTRLGSEESMAGPLLTLIYTSTKLDRAMAGWLSAVKAAAERR